MKTMHASLLPSADIALEEHSPSEDCNHQPTGSAISTFQQESAHSLALALENPQEKTVVLTSGEGLAAVDQWRKQHSKSPLQVQVQLSKKGDKSEIRNQIFAKGATMVLGKRQSQTVEYIGGEWDTYHTLEPVDEAKESQKVHNNLLYLHERLTELEAEGASPVLKVRVDSMDGMRPSHAKYLMELSTRYPKTSHAGRPRLDVQFGSAAVYADFQKVLSGQAMKPKDVAPKTQPIARSPAPAQSPALSKVSSKPLPSVQEPARPSLFKRFLKAIRG